MTKILPEYFLMLLSELIFVIHNNTKKSNHMKKILGIFAIAGIGGLTSLGVNHLINEKTQVVSQLSYQTPVKYVSLPGSAAPELAVDFTQAAESSVHSVVNVKTTYPLEAQNQYYYAPFRDFFGGQRAPQAAPMGT